MKALFRDPQFLLVYSGCLTIVLAAVLLCGFVKLESRSFDELTVHRLNVVEPDGTLRLVITDKASAPGLYLHNKEYKHDRGSAGMLFFDDEGTEDGGLIYGLDKDQNGRTNGSNVHLSFDKQMQDQIFTVDAGRHGADEYSTLTMQDRGDYPITDDLEARNRILGLPEAQRAAAWKQFFAAHPGDHTRVVLGRATDGASVLRLKDKEGRDRIVLRVAGDGTPLIETLDASGKVTGTLANTAAK